MKVIGFNLTKILSERKTKIEGELKVAQNINIKEISKTNIPISKDEALNVEFKFSIDYGGDSAKIEFEGSVMVLPEKNELKDILKLWKDKKMSDEFRLNLFNFIMGKCNIKALNIEDELGLPLHIQMPRISPDN